MVAVNINEAIISTALGIVTTRDNDIAKLSNKMSCNLLQIYSEMKALIIDEISMVSKTRLFQNHRRHCGIFNVSLDIPFAALTVIPLGGLYQFPPA